MIRCFVSGMPWITVTLFSILIVSVTMFYYLKAGWLGNDAISPIIGEHDPYYHVSSRGVNHLHAVAVLMTVVMIISLLSSIAIDRRVFMATSVLKVCSSFAFIVANLFFGVVEMSINTIILSFCQDSDEHQGTAQ
ncbi:choline transporter protein 1-like [Primulina huaijiensis]|uniref:choline transporter protein 1-like n=1 Tax=Primulina huaijiensis TaxID=1492673 RepID=UPI003CC75396